MVCALVYWGWADAPVMQMEAWKGDCVRQWKHLACGRCMKSIWRRHPTAGCGVGKGLFSTWAQRHVFTAWRTQSRAVGVPGGPSQMHLSPPAEHEGEWGQVHLLSFTIPCTHSCTKLLLPHTLLAHSAAPPPSVDPAGGLNLPEHAIEP